MDCRHVRSCTLAAAVAFAGVVAAPRAGAQPTRADLVLVNGSVVTVDSQRPRAEAVAVRGDRIIAVGTSAEIRRLTGPGTRVIDLAGVLYLRSLESPILLLVEETDDLHAASNRRALAEVSCARELKLIPEIGIDYAISKGFELSAREAADWFIKHFALAKNLHT